LTGVAIVTLNRPSARNALSLGLLQRLNIIVQQFVGMPLASTDSDFDYQHTDNQIIKESSEEFVQRLKLNSLQRPRALLLRGNGTVFSSGHDLKVPFCCENISFNLTI
jgi:enoyl-CoA hydratase/carnithine racemase